MRVGFAVVSAGLRARGVDSLKAAARSRHPVFVTEIRKGTVLRKSGRSIIVRGQDGTRRFTQDEANVNAMEIFMDGKPAKVWQLRQGDEFTALIVTRAAPVVMTETEVAATLAAPQEPEPVAAAAPEEQPAPAPSPEPTPAPAPVQEAAAPCHAGSGRPGVRSRRSRTHRRESSAGVSGASQGRVLFGYSQRRGHIVGKLDGKVALITGSGAGIGRDSALAFAREGAAVAVVDVRMPRAEQTAELVRAEGGRARAFECDVRFLDQVQTCVADALVEFGRIDAVFNDAGTTRPGDVVSVSLEDWEMVLDVNLRGTFNVSRAALPHMLARGSGAIINMGSVDGLTGDRNMAAYNAAKAAVVNLSRSMAVDFGPRGIRTNCICPGVIGSPAILKTFTDEARARMERATPLRRIGRPNDIASIAVFLASEDSAYINGAAIVADGGLMARTGIPG